MVQEQVQMTGEPCVGISWTIQRVDATPLHNPIIPGTPVMIRLDRMLRPTVRPPLSAGNPPEYISQP
jgi:hypothetical protein